PGPSFRGLLILRVDLHPGGRSPGRPGGVEVCRVRWAWGLPLLVVVSGVACSETGKSSLRHTIDGGPGDAGVDAGPTDAGPGDAGPTDAGVDAGPMDAGPGDAGPGDAGPSDGGPTDGGLPHDAGWSGAWERFGPPLGNEAQVYPAMTLDASGGLLVAYVQLVERPGGGAPELPGRRGTGAAGGRLRRVVGRAPTPPPH